MCLFGLAIFFLKQNFYPLLTFIDIWHSDHYCVFLYSQKIICSGVGPNRLKSPPPTQWCAPKATTSPCSPLWPSMTLRSALWVVWVSVATQPVRSLPVWSSRASPSPSVWKRVPLLGFRWTTSSPYLQQSVEPQHSLLSSYRPSLSRTPQGLYTLRHPS